MPRLADRSDPMVDRDFGASQTERGRATHRDAGLTLATRLTVLRARAHRVGIAAVAHLVSETVIVAGSVTRGAVVEAIPVIDKDLFEDVGVLRRCCHQQIAPRKGIGLLGRERFYHVSRSASTPSSVCTGAPSHPLARPGDTGISGQMENAISYTIKKGTWMMQDIGHLSACRLEDDPYGDHARPLPRHGLVRALDAHESG